MKDPRVAELEKFLAADDDDSDRVRGPLPPFPAPDDEALHGNHNGDRIFLRLIEWARAGRELYRAEAKGDRPERPSVIIGRAERVERGHA